MGRHGEREWAQCCRQLQSVVESGARAVGAEAGTSAYGVWLSRALGDRRLPRTVPASVRDVAKLLKCYGREFGWRLAPVASLVWQLRVDDAMGCLLPPRAAFLSSCTVTWPTALPFCAALAKIQLAGS